LAHPPETVPRAVIGPLSGTSRGHHQFDSNPALLVLNLLLPSFGEWLTHKTGASDFLVDRKGAQKQPPTDLAPLQ